MVETKTVRRDLFIAKIEENVHVYVKTVYPYCQWQCLYQSMYQVLVVNGSWDSTIQMDRILNMGELGKESRGLIDLCN